MATGSDVQLMARISETVDDLLKHLSEDSSLPQKLRVTASDVYNLYHTSVRSDILNILLPVLHRLRVRITNGDVTYFASVAFIEGVSKAVDQRCREVVAEGKMREQAVGEVGPKIQPILVAIQSIAQNYANGDVASFEFILGKMVGIIHLLKAQKTFG